MTMAGTWNCSDSVPVRLYLDICYRMRSSREVSILLLNQPIESPIHTESNWSQNCVKWLNFLLFSELLLLICVHWIWVPIMQWSMVTWPASTMNKGKWDALSSFSLWLPFSPTHSLSVSVSLSLSPPLRVASWVVSSYWLISLLNCSFSVSLTWL